MSITKGLKAGFDQLDIASLHANHSRTASRRRKEHRWLSKGRRLFLKKLFEKELYE